jgi:signal transduction histidine kinase
MSEAVSDGTWITDAFGGSVHGLAIAMDVSKLINGPIWVSKNHVESVHRFVLQNKKQKLSR